MTPLVESVLVGEWAVVARRFATEAAAAARWRRLHDLHRSGDFSIWRTTTPDRELHLVVLCGAPDRLAGVVVGGQPFALDRASAERFALRRARALVEALEADPGAAEHSTEAHYPDGVRIDRQGNVR